MGARIEQVGGVRGVGSLRLLEEGDPARAATEIGAGERGAAHVIAGHLEGDGPEEAPGREIADEQAAEDAPGPVLHGREDPRGAPGCSRRGASPAGAPTARSAGHAVRGW